MPTRYFMEIQYHGANYHGWQVQKNATTVQEVINEALSKTLAAPINCVGSGRTDTGVHAIQQFAHFDCDVPVNANHLVYRLNSFLPPDISVKRIFPVQKEAHARFDAEKRAYRYYIHSHKDPFKKETSYYFPHTLNIQWMNEAARQLVGVQDFESFSRVKTDVNHFMCEVFQANWEIVENGLVFHVSADRFLRGMVRALVGTLLDIGQCKLSVEDMTFILGQKNRQKAGRAVPACGLFLTEVKYPSTIYLD